MQPTTVTVPIKPWYASKTIWINVIMTAVGIVAVLSSQYPDLAILVTITSVLNVILRSVTASAIGSQ